MRRMLDPKEAGGGALPSTIQFDEAGNRTASKDVKVDGKLKLQSLVSASNPDGDITKELGGGGGGGSTTLYRHCVRLVGEGNNPVDIISFNLYTTNSAKIEWADLYTYAEKCVACSGYAYNSGSSKCYFANAIYFRSNGTALVYAVDTADWSAKNLIIHSGNYRVDDYIYQVF